jgi:hypothetical protein
MAEEESPALSEGNARNLLPLKENGKPVKGQTIMWEDIEFDGIARN